MSLNLILFYIIAFIVLYLEPISIAGMSFGVLWKIIAIPILSLPILYEAFKEKKMELFVVLYLIFAFKTLFSYTSMDYPLETITIAIKIIMFPILYLYFMKLPKETLLFLAKHYAIVIILVFVPYLFDLIEPLGEGYPLKIYGLDGEFGLVGPFLFPHSASISLAFAMIVITLLINSNNSRIANFLYLLILFLGFYELMLTYVRTGIVMYLAVLVYLFSRNLNMKKVLLIILTMSVLVGGSMYLMSTSEIAKMRFEDRNKYVKQDDIGSGRLLYWHAAVDNWLNDEDIVILIGLGFTYATEKMEKSVGLKIFAHNEFFQMLQQEGLIGFILFICSLIVLYKYMKRYKTSKYYQNSMATFIGMISMMMFQGGFYFNIIIFLAIYLALQKKEFIEGNNHKKI